MISAVWMHRDGYKFEERYVDKSSFRRAYNRTMKKAVADFIHATDFDSGQAVYPANVWGFLRS